MTDPGKSSVVLVHGAFADASGFTGVISELLASGHSVVAPPNPLRGLGDDAAAIQAVVAAIDGPVVLVGHSYGGAVITQASASLDNVTALVYLAAFSLNEGESCSTVQEPFPPSMLADTVRPTLYDAPGAGGGPDLYIDPAGFRETFCADVAVNLAQAMCAAQRPLAAAAFTENATAAGWKRLPTWYQVARHDHAIPPDAQRYMAGRMGSTVEEIDGSHSAFIAQPAAAADIIRRALAKS
ncbi:alpha/beta hydrolase [Streptacidiphilus sp. EB129]|uniref:alpha/beta hydrolase n=1 Tax=Streptacidiphilus sp. EB129 TaxID=3156262 RepID=UPI00351346F0